MTGMSGSGWPRDIARTTQSVRWRVGDRGQEKIGKSSACLLLLRPVLTLLSVSDQGSQAFQTASLSATHLAPASSAVIPWLVM